MHSKIEIILEFQSSNNIGNILLLLYYNNNKYWASVTKCMNSNIHRALVFQGGGSLGAYEAGAYKAINEDLSDSLRTKGRGNEPLFHIGSGTSIGAINAALLVSYVKENKTWEGSDERLIELWDYLSTQSSVENIPYFT